jgi:hypothetical protein
MLNKKFLMITLITVIMHLTFSLKSSYFCNTINIKLNANLSNVLVDLILIIVV